MSQSCSVRLSISEDAKRWWGHGEVEVRTFMQEEGGHAQGQHRAFNGAKHEQRARTKQIKHPWAIEAGPQAVVVAAVGWGLSGSSVAAHPTG